MIVAIVIASLAVIAVVALVGYLIDRMDRRAHSEREAIRRDNQVNLNRLQDPTAAVMQSFMDEPESFVVEPEEETSAWPAN